MKRVDTPSGRFEAGDPTIRKPGSILPAWFMNMLQDELCNVIELSGLELDGNDSEQVFRAIERMIATGLTGYLPRLESIPGQKLASEIYVSGWGELVWVETSFFEGYRSPFCGRPVDGHTAVPLAREVDAIGGLLSKTAYAGLWGYAQEQGLVMNEANWATNRGGHFFSDYSSSQFRVPDLRNMFRRFTGTDADTANARVVGSRQRDAIRNMTGSTGALYRSGEAVASGVLFIGPWGNTPAKVGVSGADPGDNGTVGFDASRQVPTSTENRPVNTAYHPRIHA